MSLIMIFFRIFFKPWILLRQTNESRLVLLKHPSCHFLCHFFQNAGMKQSSFSEPSALNSFSFLSTMVSSSCSHCLSFALMFELTTLVGNWGKVWIHSASLLFSLFYAAEELLFFCLKLCEINLFSSGSMKTSAVPLFLHIGPLCTDLFSFLRLSLQSSLTYFPIWDTDFWCNLLTCLSWNYFHLLHVEDSGCWRMWDAAAADSRVCFSSAEYPDFSVSVAGWSIMGNSWRMRQLLQVPAGGISPRCDSATLTGAQALSQSVLGFEMKAEALAEYFPSHWYSVFGHDRKWEPGREHKVHQAVGWAWDTK